MLSVCSEVMGSVDGGCVDVGTGVMIGISVRGLFEAVSHQLFLSQSDYEDRK